MHDLARTSAHERVLNALDVEAMVADLVAWVRVPSVTGTDGESDLQDLLAGRLRELGMDVDLWKLNLAELTSDPDFPGLEAPRTEGYGLVGTSAGEGEVALVLQGHTDVVPTGDLAKWVDGDPFSGTVTSGVVHGRGTCDMKAGMVANLAVAKALATSGLRFERRFAVHQVVSEEDGGLGAFATLRRGHGGEVCVITEPTSGRVVTANAGALTFAIEVPGRAAHGSTRLEGVSALDAFWPIHRALGALEARRNTRVDPLFLGNPLPYGLSIGTIRAGDWASSVPDVLVAEGRLGVRLGEDPDEARRQFTEAVADACQADPWLRQHPAVVSWPGGQFGSGQLDQAHPFVDEVRSAVAAIRGTAPQVGAAPYGSDLRLYLGMGGIPTLQYGPGDVRFAHAPREQVRIVEMVEVAQALCVLAVDRLGGHL